MKKQALAMLLVGIILMAVCAGAIVEAEEAYETRKPYSVGNLCVTVPVEWDETDVIMDKLIPLAESQGSRNAGKLYMTYSNLVNATLEIEAGKRDNLPLAYVDAIKFLERAIENIIAIEAAKGTHYKEIYIICKAKCQIIKDLAFLPQLRITG